MHNSSSPELSGDLDLFDKTGNDHAKGGSPAPHLVGEDARSGCGLLLQHLNHDVETFLSWGAVLVHRASLAHQIRETFFLHRFIDASNLKKSFFPTDWTEARSHLLQGFHVFAFKLHRHLLIFALHWILSKRMIFVNLQVSLVQVSKVSKRLLTFTLLSFEMSWMCLR